MNCLSEESINILKKSENYDVFPYKHIVIDNFLKKKYISESVKYVKDLELSECSNNRLPPNKNTQYKYAYENIDTFPRKVRAIFKELNSAKFINILSKFTGIEDLIPGNLSLKGAGIHKIANNGFLNLHTDFNNYEDTILGSLDRRINLLIYLNHEWKEEYNGHLWICDKDNKKISKKVLPIINRCVIFNTTNKSVHGHPIKLNVPDNMHRNSIALYYYTRNKKKNKCFEGDKFHSTIYYNTGDYV
tara:strand:+ start:522 stop:1259 length:738 start_codon:yes stop_codon:yes gene_type:complete